MIAPHSPETSARQPEGSEGSESFSYGSKKALARAAHEATMLRFMLQAARDVTIDQDRSMDPYLSELDTLVTEYDEVAPRKAS